MPGRLGAGEERLADHLRAARRGELAGSGSMSTNATPSGASNGTLARAGERAHHELRPDRQRRLRARQPERLVVVEADPDDRQELGREADEPGVAQIVGRAGLAGGVEREPGARAPAPVPSLMTLRIMLVTRYVVSGRAISCGWPSAASGDVLRRRCRCGGCAAAAARPPCSGRSCRPWRFRTASPRTRRAQSTDTAFGGVPTPSRFHELRDVVVAGALGDLDRRDVARVRERAPQRDRARRTRCS